MNLSWNSRLISCHSCYDSLYNDYIIQPWPSAACSKQFCSNAVRSKDNDQRCVLDVSLLPETIEEINNKRILIRQKKFKNEDDVENSVKEFFN